MSENNKISLNLAQALEAGKMAGLTRPAINIPLDDAKRLVTLIELAGASRLPIGVDGPTVARFGRTMRRWITYSRLIGNPGVSIQLSNDDLKRLADVAALGEKMEDLQP